MKLGRLALGVLLALIIILTSVTLLGYQQIIGTQHSTRVELTFPGASEPTLATVTIEGGQPTSSQTCYSQAETPTSCNFNPDGYLDIEGLPRFYYLDVTGLPTNFTFEGVMFNGTVSNNYCAPHAECTGPAQACVIYSALIKNGTSYNMGECVDAPFPPNLLYLDPHGSPQVGFLSLPDGSIYVLVLDK
jgi:hypothetical protein